MKTRITFFLAFTLIAAIGFGQNNTNLVFYPNYPKPGEKVQFEYSPTGTPLGGLKDFDAVGYIYDGQLRAQEVKLEPSGDKWKGEIRTNDSTRAIAIVFKKDEQIDNNKEQGYSQMLYKTSEPVKGALIAIAEINTGIGSYLMQLKTDPQKNIDLYEEEFKNYPDLRENSLVGYAVLLVKLDKNSAKEKIQGYVDELEAKKNKTEKDYDVLLGVYRRLSDKEQADRVMAEVKKKFPKGSQAKNELVTSFYNEGDLSKKEALLNRLLHEFPPKTGDDKKQVDGYYAVLASAAGAKKDWALFKKYAQKVTHKDVLAGTYNNLAWSLAGEGLDGAGTNLDLAKDVSFKSLQYVKDEMKDASGKPAYYSAKEWQKNLDYTYGTYSDTYALVLWKVGEWPQAYEHQKEAVEKMNMGDGEANERYIVYKEKVKGTDAVKADIENFIREGKSSPKMTEILKRSFIDAGHSDAEFAAYMSELQKQYREKLREEIMKQMIDEAAPQFALKDLSGNTISLSELKGKVVVVDFWATWCGPCKASFPGMQKTLEKYKNDPDVKFVFVDSWENKKPDEMQKNASEFVAKNKYDFQVLLDTEDKTIGSYAVEGIPTKFLIDKDNKIRFKAVGYDGNMDKLIDEVSQMIEVLKDGAGAGDSKKAF